MKIGACRSFHRARPAPGAPDKEKDAYDIYVCLANYPGGIDALVNEFQALRDNGLVRESLGKICAKFKTIHSIGPVWAAQVVQAAGGATAI